MGRLCTLGSLGLSALLLGAPAASAATDAEVEACIERNAPEPENVRAVRITRRDPRAGSKRIIILKLFGERTPDGSRQLLVRFLEPDDIRGASILLLEREGGSEVYMASPELPKPQRIRSSDRAGVLFGTDVSFEDLEWLEGFRVGSALERQADSKEGLHDVYVVETHPEASAYSRVISYVDKETCLPLRMDLFGANGRLRKEVTTDRRAHVRHGDAWVAHDMLVRDVRDLTSTHFMTDTHQQDVLLPDGLFSVEGMARAVREDPVVRSGAAP
jgi:hypothetical protein